MQLRLPVAVYVDGEPDDVYAWYFLVLWERADFLVADVVFYAIKHSVSLPRLLVETRAVDFDWVEAL